MVSNVLKDGLEVDQHGPSSPAQSSVSSSADADFDDAGSDDDGSNSKGRFSEEEKRILFSVIREDNRLLHEFLHQTKARTHGRKGWMHEIGDRFNQRSPTKRRLDAVRHHLLLRKTSQGMQDEFSQVHHLLNHAVYCNKRDTCTKCLLLDRYRVQQGLAKCGLQNCIACDESIPHVNQPYDAEALRLQISTRLASRRSPPRLHALVIPPMISLPPPRAMHCSPPQQQQPSPSMCAHVTESYSPCTPPLLSPRVAPSTPPMCTPTAASISVVNPQVLSRSPQAKPRLNLDFSFLSVLKDPPSLAILQQLCQVKSASSSPTHSSSDHVASTIRASTLPTSPSMISRPLKRSAATAALSSPTHAAAAAAYLQQHTTLQQQQQQQQQKQMPNGLPNRAMSTATCLQKTLSSALEHQSQRHRNSQSQLPASLCKRLRLEVTTIPPPPPTSTTDAAAAMNLALGRSLPMF